MVSLSNYSPYYSLVHLAAVIQFLGPFTLQACPSEKVFTHSLLRSCFVTVPSMTSPVVLTAVDGPVGVITLNRPARLNAWTGQLNTELFDALERFDADEGVRVIVVTGAGRGFCAGAGSWRTSMALLLSKHKSIRIWLLHATQVLGLLR